MDDEGLREFYDQYFPFPLYRDEGLGFYEAFGNGSITEGMSWNPFKLWRGMKQVGNRLKEKKIEGNMKGEGMTTGGFLIFGSGGDPKYMYKEDTGNPIDEELLIAAVRSVREGQTSPAPLEEL